MKTIKKSEYRNQGVFIDLDVNFKPYENLINNHNIYLSKDKKVTAILEAYGYDTTYVMN